MSNYKGNITMNTILPLLLALIVVPAWAGDVASAPSMPKQKPMQTSLVTETGVVIELKGSARNTSALVADLEKDAVYKEAACSKKPGKIVRISCAKADSALMAFLSKNAPANVHWRISTATSTRLSTEPVGCASGCVLAPCPTTVVCCSITTHQPC